MIVVRTAKEWHQKNTLKNNTPFSLTILVADVELCLYSSTIEYPNPLIIFYRSLRLNPFNTC